MEKKLITVIALSATASLLALSHLLVGTAQAGPVGSVASNRDYSVVTAKSSASTDTLYILDNRRGLVAVFQYDTSTRQLRPQIVRPLAEVLTPTGR